MDLSIDLGFSPKHNQKSLAALPRNVLLPHSAPGTNVANHRQDLPAPVANPGIEAQIYGFLWIIVVNND